MKRNDNGSITIEAMLLVPTVFLFSSLIVYVGRMTDAAITVRRAADIAARVASQANEKSANYRAIQIVKQEVGSLTSACDDSGVHVQKVKSNLETTYVVKVNCSINTHGLGLLSLIPITVSAESSEIVDVYTAR